MKRNVQAFSPGAGIEGSARKGRQSSGGGGGRFFAELLLSGMKNDDDENMNNIVCVNAIYITS
jgi:hypothetical protein